MTSVVRCYEGFARLPSAHRLLIDQAARDNLFHDPDWFEFLLRHFYPNGHRLVVVAVENSAGLPLLICPMRFCRIDYAAYGAATLGAISHPENYSPLTMLFSPEVTERWRLLEGLFRALRRGVDGLSVDVLRLWPVDLGSEEGSAVREALRFAGFVFQTYANSFNRFENTHGLNHESYLNLRSANHRYNIRRRQRALEKTGKLEMGLYRVAGGELELALSDYAKVALASWKDADTMVSDDIFELIRLSAQKGCLRLGLLRVDDVPVAAQFWIVTGHVAHCARLAYNEQYKHLAVGVVLTNFMIAHVLDGDHVQRIDFGYGEDDYKGGWMKEARDYVGFLAFNPGTRAGWWYGLRNIVGRPVKRWSKALLNRIRG